MANTITELKALAKAGLTDGEVRVVSGAATDGDGSARGYRWDASSTDTQNGTTIVITDEGGTGRWHMILTQDHGEQTGLGDDDHTQYHNDTRGDARYYTQGAADAAFAPIASTAYVNVKLFGAVCDGVTDDRTAIVNTAASLTNNEVLLIPADTFIGSDLDLERTPVLALGSILFDDGTTITIGGDASAGAPYSFNVIGTVGETATFTSNDKTTPFLLVQGLKGGDIHVGRCAYVKLFANSAVSEIGATAYNTFYFNHLTRLEIDSSGTGWVNENVFHVNRMSIFRISSGGWSHSNNKVLGAAFENTAYNPIIEMDSCSSNLVSGRCEGNSGDLDITFGSTAIHNTIIKENYSSADGDTYNLFNGDITRVGSGGTYSDSGTHNRVVYRAELLGDWSKELIAVTDPLTAVSSWTWLHNTVNQYRIRKGDVLTFEVPDTGTVGGYRFFFRLLKGDQTTQVFTDDTEMQAAINQSGTLFDYSAAVSGLAFGDGGALSANRTIDAAIEIVDAETEWLQFAIRAGNSGPYTTTEGVRVVIQHDRATPLADYLDLTGTSQVAGLTADTAPTWVLTESSGGAVRKTSPQDIYEPGFVVDQANYTIEEGGNITGSVTATALNFNNQSELRLTLTGSITGAFPLPTGVAGMDAVGEKCLLTLYLEQDGTGGRTMDGAQFDNFTEVGDFPVVNTAADTFIAVTLEGEVTSIGPVVISWLAYLGPKFRRTNATYSGTAKTFNSDSITDADSFVNFTNASAKTLTITAGDGMVGGDYIAGVNTGAADLTVVQGSGMTLTGNLTFAQNTVYGVHFLGTTGAASTTAVVIGGTA